MKIMAPWITIPVVRRNSDVSEEHIASIYRAKYKPSKKPEE
jgi:hypothetical protein